MTLPNYQYLKMKMDIAAAGTLKKRLGGFCRHLNWVGLAKEVGPFLLSPNESRRVADFPKFIKTARW